MFQVTPTPDTLHLRQGTGTAFDSIGFVKKGAALTVLAIDGSGTWLQVKEAGKNGKTGWCSARYLLPIVLPAAGSTTPWLAIAAKEIGTKEYPGDNANHPRIQQYLATVNNLSAIDKLKDETPWCSCFMNWCVGQADMAGTDSAWAKSWGNWRNAVAPSAMQTGDIAVFDRSSAAGGGGHVGIAITQDTAKQTILLLGGNQSDAVRYAWYPMDGVQRSTHYQLLSLRRA